jgi:GntR family transcriptional regulator
VRFGSYLFIISGDAVPKFLLTLLYVWYYSSYTVLPFTVEFRSGEPVYEQVMYAVKKAVMSGQLSSGDRFPSVRTLSQELKINPRTAHKVVAALTDEGVLAVQPGIGTVVTASSNGSSADKTALLTSDVERLVVEADRLGLTEEQVVTAVRRHWHKLSPKS